MIPKIIHYCWFGKSPLPSLAVRCIESWKKFAPDYEIKEWNETNFDVNIVPYTTKAYQAKKYAFVSDYARFWILYKFGGIYFDTDVEIIKPLDDIIAQGPFMGCENVINESNGNALRVNPGLGLGTNSGLFFYKKMLDLYETLCPVGNQFGTVVKYTSDMLYSHGLKSVNEIQRCDDIWIYPKEYFSPIDYLTGKRTDTINTYTVHYFAGSWLKSPLRIFLSHFLSERLIDVLASIKHFIVRNISK